MIWVTCRVGISMGRDGVLIRQERVFHHGCTQGTRTDGDLPALAVVRRERDSMTNASRKRDRPGWPVVAPVQAQRHFHPAPIAAHAMLASNVRPAQKIRVNPYACVVQTSRPVLDFRWYPQKDTNDLGDTSGRIGVDTAVLIRQKSVFHHGCTQMHTDGDLPALAAVRHERDSMTNASRKGGGQIGRSSCGLERRRYRHAAPIAARAILASDV